MQRGGPVWCASLDPTKLMPDEFELHDRYRVHAGQARRPWDPHEGDGEGRKGGNCRVLASGVLKALPRQGAPRQGCVSILQSRSVRGPLTHPDSGCVRLGSAGAAGIPSVAAPHP